MQPHAELAGQRSKVRSELKVRVEDLIALIFASPESTISLTRDVLQDIILGVGETLDATRPVVARSEARLWNLGEAAVTRIDGGYVLHSNE